MKYSIYLKLDTIGYFYQNYALFSLFKNTYTARVEVDTSSVGGQPSNKFIGLVETPITITANFTVIYGI